MTSLEFTARSGIDYYVVIDCVDGEESAFSLQVTCDAAPGEPEPK